MAGLRSVVLEEHRLVLSVSLLDLCLACLNVATETDVAVHLSPSAHTYSSVFGLFFS